MEATRHNNHVFDDRTPSVRPVENTGWYLTEAGNYKWYYWRAGSLREGVTVRDPNLCDRLLEEAEDARRKRTVGAK